LVQFCACRKPTKIIWRIGDIRCSGDGRDALDYAVAAMVTPRIESESLSPQFL